MKKKELRRQIAQLRSQIRAVQLENSSLRLEISCGEWRIRNLQASLNMRDALQGRFDGSRPPRPPAHDH
jgi:hypothetical protein